MSKEKPAPSRAFTVAETVFTINEAAAFLRVSRATVYNLIGDRKVTPRKLGTRTIITGQELERFVASLPAA